MTTHDHSPASKGAAIAGHWGQAGECRDAPAIQVSELRQISDESV